MENENQVVKQKSNKGVIIVLIILVLGLCTYIAYDKFVLDKDSKTNEVRQTNVKEESKNDNTTVQTTTNNIDKEQILKEVTGVYQNAYKAFFNIEWAKDESYYKSKYGDYFTIDGVTRVFIMLQDESATRIMQSMFNEVDQGMRTLSLVLATDDTVIATGTYTGEGDKTPYPEYIVFKKVDGVWKIDMFE